MKLRNKREELLQQSQLFGRVVRRMLLLQKITQMTPWLEFTRNHDIHFRIK